MPKALFYTPYLDSLGGGERYTLTLAHALKKRGWQISLLWDHPDIAGQIQSKFGFKFSSSDFHPNIFIPSSHITRHSERNKESPPGPTSAQLKHLPIPSSLNRVLHLKNYDLCFILSDGSIPLLSAKTNILHFQIPFHNIHGKSLANQLKLKNIHHVVCNSQFTKKFIDTEFNINSQVVYPPIDTKNFKPGKKQNLILYVGRFSKLMQSKNHSLLIREFQKLVNRADLKSWRLVLAGGAGVGTGNFIQELKTQAQNHPIDILPNPDFRLLKKLYSQAKIFWSASGYGINPEKEPEKCEHFGITVVEAMTAGAVPIAVNLGGHPEIITHHKNGFLWGSPEDLRAYTLNLINDQTDWQTLSQAAQSRAQAFSTQNFVSNFSQIIKA
jgi:glycosyltransferase involved in cell wall biosynthesis